MATESKTSNIITKVALIVISLLFFFLLYDYFVADTNPLIHFEDWFDEQDTAMLKDLARSMKGPFKCKYIIIRCTGNDEATITADGENSAYSVSYFSVYKKESGTWRLESSGVSKSLP